MGEDKRFTIKIEGEVFYSDSEGLLNLNDIWNVCNLPKSKRPNQWRSQVSEYLFEAANLQSLKNKELGSNLEYTFIAADEKAAIAYAMWVSVPFYIQVVEAFIELRLGNAEEAVLIAGGTLSEEDEHLLVKFASMKGLCFTKSCWYANIQHPTKFLNYLKRNSNWKYFTENVHGRLVATDLGIKNKITYNCYGDPDSSKVVMRFTQKGRDLLRKHHVHFNKKVQDAYQTL